MKLIDKDTLVAEIKKLKGKVSDGSSYCNGWQHALRMLELSIDTLEVKEVDIAIPNIDELFEEDGIDSNSKDVKVFKECYYTALERLKEKKGK